MHTSNTPVFRTFAKYVSLNVLGMIGLSCYILADTFFIARGIGADGLTALNLAIPVYGVMHGMGLMIGMGGATRYSILKTQSDRQASDVVFTRSVQLALICSLLFMCLGFFFSAPLSSFLGADRQVQGITSIYLKTFLSFAPLFFLNDTLICFVRNDDNPNLSMLGMLIGSLSNIVLDYIFVFPFGLGMFGAAFATCCAPFISICILSLHFIRKKNRFWFKKCLLSFHFIRDTVSLGISSFITELSSSIVIMIFNIIILGLNGNIGVAAYGVIANLALVVISIFTGMAQGIQPIISDAYGRKDKTVIHKTYRYAAITSLLFATVIYVLTIANGTWIVNAFNKDNDTLLTAIALDGLKIYFVGFFAAGFNVITSVFFSSIDNPKYAFTLSILRGVVLIVPIAFLLPVAFQMTGVWLAFPLTEFITLIFAFLFLKNAFKKTV